MAAASNLPEKVPLKNVISNRDDSDLANGQPQQDKMLKTKSDLPERDKWGNIFEFFLSCIGYAVGLGTTSVAHPLISYQ